MNKNQEYNSDDKLLVSFFNDHKMEIKNNGFSNKVMLKLGRRASRLNRLLQAICIGLSALIFFKFDGIQDAHGFFKHLFHSFEQAFTTLHVQPLVLVAGCMILFVIGTYNYISSQM